LERHVEWPDAVLAWDGYRAAAVRAGALPPAGPEMSRLLLHMTELFPSAPADILNEFDAESEEELQAKVRSGELPECMDPGHLLARARAAEPSRAVFRAMVDHYDQRDPKTAEAEAEAWRRAHPRDLEPILYLIRAAERRGAIQKALAALADAEAIDQVNPEVRRSRFRLLLVSAEQHIKDARPDLAERDLDRLAREPAADEGDTSAYLLVLRWAVERTRGNATAATEIEDGLTARTGNPGLAHLIMTAVATSFGLEEMVNRFQIPSQVQSVEALARAGALFRKLGRALFVAPEFAARVERDMSGVSTPHLHALCEVGLAIGRYSLTYAASGEGLARGTTLVHRFLLARGRALRMATTHREHERAERCFRAARELAGRARDLEAVREASVALKQIAAEADVFGFEGRFFGDGAPPTPEEIVRLVVEERSRRDVPPFAVSPARRRRRKRAKQQRLFDDFMASLEKDL